MPLKINLPSASGSYSFPSGVTRVRPVLFSSSIDTAIKAIAAVGFIYALYSSVEFACSHFVFYKPSWAEKFLKDSKTPIPLGEEGLLFNFPDIHKGEEKDNESLKKLVEKCPNLKLLNLSGFKHLTIDTLSYLLLELKELEELNLSNTNLNDDDFKILTEKLDEGKLTPRPVSRVILSKLKLSGPSSVEFINLYVEKLIYLNLSHNPELLTSSLLVLNSSSLEELDVSSCPKLKGDEMAEGKRGGFLSALCTLRAINSNDIFSRRFLKSLQLSFARLTKIIVEENYPEELREGFTTLTSKCEEIEVLYPEPKNFFHHLNLK
ncbi:hypothetical protein AB751O23_BD_00060 [Chlamydiales bacterium SCGC AB-751-O23]|jgi:hypothetical protein|nr:hypothetical protein AB751O23_BD_00060 [Chlamydiales bacterium SCGC AB-751-O23]